MGYSASGDAVLLGTEAANLLALSIWLNIVQIDVLWQLSEIELDKDSPVYWRTTLLRTIVGVAFCAAFHFAGADWIRIAGMQAGIYSLAFSIPLNVARRKPKPFLYMGTRSLPERIFKGRPVLYLISKIVMFLIGMGALWL